MTSLEYNIPGNNRASYGPIPQAEQVFGIELFEVGPLPIPVDRIFFTLLRGFIPESKAKALGIDDAALSKATLTVTRFVVYQDGQHGGPWPVTIPLRTFAAYPAHLAIRNSSGVHVDYLTMGVSEGRVTNDIITDFWIPGMLLETGNWTFEFVAKIPGEICLFALTFTQWLEGRQKRTSPQSGELDIVPAVHGGEAQQTDKQKVQ